MMPRRLAPAKSSMNFCVVSSVRLPMMWKIINRLTCQTHFAWCPCVPHRSWDTFVDVPDPLHRTASRCISFHFSNPDGK